MTGVSDVCVRCSFPRVGKGEEGRIYLQRSRPTSIPEHILQCNVNFSTVQLYSVLGSSLLGGLCCSHLGGAVLPVGGQWAELPRTLQADLLGGCSCLSALVFTALSSRGGEAPPERKGKRRFRERLQHKGDIKVT